MAYSSPEFNAYFHVLAPDGPFVMLATTALTLLRPWRWVSDPGLLQLFACNARVALVQRFYPCLITSHSGSYPPDLARPLSFSGAQGFGGWARQLAYTFGLRPPSDDDCEYEPWVHFINVAAALVRALDSLLFAPAIPAADVLGLHDFEVSGWVRGVLADIVGLGDTGVTAHAFSGSAVLARVSFRSVQFPDCRCLCRVFEVDDDLETLSISRDLMSMRNSDGFWGVDDYAQQFAIDPSLAHALLSRAGTRGSALQVALDATAAAYAHAVPRFAALGNVGRPGPRYDGSRPALQEWLWGSDTVRTDLVVWWRSGSQGPFPSDRAGAFSECAGETLVPVSLRIECRDPMVYAPVVLVSDVFHVMDRACTDLALGTALDYRQLAGWVGVMWGAYLYHLTVTPQHDLAFAGSGAVVRVPGDAEHLGWVVREAPRSAAHVNVGLFNLRGQPAADLMPPGYWRVVAGRRGCVLTHLPQGFPDVNARWIEPLSEIEVAAPPLLEDMARFETDGCEGNEPLPEPGAVGFAAPASVLQDEALSLAMRSLYVEQPLHEPHALSIARDRRTIMLRWHVLSAGALQFQGANSVPPGVRIAVTRVLTATWVDSYESEELVRVSTRLRTEPQPRGAWPALAADVLGMVVMFAPLLGPLGRSDAASVIVTNHGAAVCAHWPLPPLLSQGGPCSCLFDRQLATRPALLRDALSWPPASARPVRCDARNVFVVALGMSQDRFLSPDRHVRRVFNLAYGADRGVTGGDEWYYRVLPGPMEACVVSARHAHVEACHHRLLSRDGRRLCEPFEARSFGGYARSIGATLTANPLPRPLVTCVSHYVSAGRHPGCRRHSVFPRRS